VSQPPSFVFWAPFWVPFILPWVFVILWRRELSHKVAFVVITFFAAVGANFIVTNVSSAILAPYFAKPTSSHALYMGYPIWIWLQLLSRLIISTLVVIAVMWGLRIAFRRSKTNVE